MMRSVARILQRRTTLTKPCQCGGLQAEELRKTRLIRRKKREQKRREREEIEMYSSRNDAQKFFKNVKRLMEGFKPRASHCRDERGNLVTNAQGMLRFNCALFYVIARLQRH